MSIVVFFYITYMHTCATDQWTLTMEEDLEKMSKGIVLMELRKDFGETTTVTVKGKVSGGWPLFYLNKWPYQLSRSAGCVNKEFF